MQPDYANLFNMRDPFATRPMRLDVGKDPRLRMESFNDFAYSLYRGEVDADPPLQLWPLTRGAPTDLMWSDYIPIRVVSRRVVDTLKMHGLTGWGTYQVEVHDKQGNVLPGYYGFAVTGRAGPRDLRRGRVIDKPPKVPGGTPYQVLKGTYFAGDYWDGSDFCLMDKSGFTVVNRQVVNTFKREGIRNVIFTPLEDEETDIGIFVIMGLWPPKED